VRGKRERIGLHGNGVEQLAHAVTRLHLQIRPTRRPARSRREQASRERLRDHRRACAHGGRQRRSRAGVGEIARLFERVGEPRGGLRSREGEAQRRRRVRLALRVASDQAFGARLDARVAGRARAVCDRERRFAPIGRARERETRAPVRLLEAALRVTVCGDALVEPERAGRRTVDGIDQDRVGLRERRRALGAGEAGARAADHLHGAAARRAAEHLAERGSAANRIPIAAEGASLDPNRVRAAVRAGRAREARAAGGAEPADGKGADIERAAARIRAVQDRLRSAAGASREALPPDGRLPQPELTARLAAHPIRRERIAGRGALDGGGPAARQRALHFDEPASGGSPEARDGRLAGRAGLVLAGATTRPGSRLHQDVDFVGALSFAGGGRVRVATARAEPAGRGLDPAAGPAARGGDGPGDGDALGLRLRLAVRVAAARVGEVGGLGVGEHAAVARDRDADRRRDRRQAPAALHRHARRLCEGVGGTAPRGAGARAGSSGVACGAERAGANRAEEIRPDRRGQRVAAVARADPPGGGKAREVELRALRFSLLNARRAAGHAGGHATRHTAVAADRALLQAENSGGEAVRDVVERGVGAVAGGIGGRSAFPARDHRHAAAARRTCERGLQRRHTAVHTRAADRGHAHSDVAIALAGDRGDGVAAVCLLAQAALGLRRQEEVPAVRVDSVERRTCAPALPELRVAAADLLHQRQAAPGRALHQVDQLGVVAVAHLARAHGLARRHAHGAATRRDCRRGLHRRHAAAHARAADRGHGHGDIAPALARDRGDGVAAVSALALAARGLRRRREIPAVRVDAGER